MEDDNTELADKPRRLEEETSNYLCQIETQFTDKLDAEEKQILVENVLAEIKTRTASATCDRRTNFMMEKICLAADLKCLLEITRRCTPYGVFLARNRYSSHVMQAIIARFCYILKFEDFGDIEASEVRDVIVDIARPILKEISWLGKEMSASHVLRSLFCLMTGMPVIAERKGKNSKHQHSISLSEPLESLVEAGRFYISKSVCFSVPEIFHDLMVEAVNSLLSVTSREIQVMIADSSCCAVLGLLVRILTNREVLSEGRGPELAHRMFRLALEWDEDDTLTSESTLQGAAGIFYAMAGDRSGSYFLESLIECADVSFLVPLLAGTIVRRAKEYSDDSAGNFVLQAILRRLSAEMQRHHQNKENEAGSSSSKKKNSSSSQRKELDQLDKISDALLEELTEKDTFESLVGTKGGVILWLLDLAQYKADDKWAEKVGVSLIDNWVAAEAAVTTDSSYSIKPRELQLVPIWNKRFSPAAIGASAEGDASATAATTAADKNKKGPEKSGNKPRGPDVDTAQLLLARLVGYLLKSRVTSVSAAASSALSKLSPDVLKHIATSGPISRAVMDVFFERFSATSEFKALGAGLCVSAVELADHYVGQHIVRRSFECSDLRGKEKWAMALSAAKDKLVVRKEGRGSLQVVNAELYSRDPAEWRSLMKKQAKASQMLQELEHDSTVVVGGGGVEKKSKKHHDETKPSGAVPKTSATPVPTAPVSAASAGDNDEEAPAAGAAGGAGRKRKRKRNNNNAANKAGGAAAAGDAMDEDD